MPTPNVQRDRVHDIRTGDRWLVVVAHPDDETFGCGSLIAHASRGGADVTVVCATRGELGERSPAIPDAADLAEVRTAELREAAAVLGATRVELLDFIDSDFDGDAPPDSLYGAPAEAVADTLAALIGSVAPDVVVTLDGGDGHRDHLRIRDCTRQALAEAGDEVVLLELGFPVSFGRLWLDEMGATAPHAQFEDADPETFGTPDDVFTDVLRLDDVLELREAAIARHRSQRSPYDDLSPELRRRFLTETYVTRVPIGR